MAEFDPERFEAEKYTEYFPQLQQAYRRAFETMNERYDSTLIHAIDQQVLSESEPFYEDGDFLVELPDEPSPTERVRNAGVMADEEKVAGVLERYREELRAEHRRVFGLE